MNEFPTLKESWKYYTPIWGLYIEPWRDKNNLLNDMGDDAFKLVWVMWHLLTTMPINVGIGYGLLFLFGIL